MRYSYKVFQMLTSNGLVWVASSDGLAHCVGQGETKKKAIQSLEENEKVWIETALELGFELPTKGLLH